MDFCVMTLSTLTTRAALTLCVGLLVAGCSTDESLPQLDVDPAQSADETRAGTLLAEYVEPRAARAGGLSVHAQFLDLQGVPYSTALEALEMWSPDWALDVDACSLRSRGPVGQEHAENIRLHLLDVGPITVRGPSEAIRLDARRLPDLLSAFSGVIYGTERDFGAEPLQIAYNPGHWYSLTAPGGPESGGFDLDMRAPESVRVVGLGDRAVGDQVRLDWDFSRDLSFSWTAPTEASSGQEVFVDISSGFGPDRPRLTCRVDDDGEFTLPASVFGQLGDDTDELELSIRRISADRVAVDGLETTEFIFSTVDELTLVDRAE